MYATMVDANGLHSSKKISSPYIICRNAKAILYVAALRFILELMEALYGAKRAHRVWRFVLYGDVIIHGPRCVPYSLTRSTIKNPTTPLSRAVM